MPHLPLSTASLATGLLAAVHLSLVALNAAHVPLPRDGWLGGVLHWYGEASGAGGGYSFFAPGVGDSMRARFELVDEGGRRWTRSLEFGGSREAELRVLNIVGRLWDDLISPEDRRQVMASLAGRVLGEHPSAMSVVVRLESFDLPSMEEHRQGRSGQWLTYYEATFARRN